jgi:Fe-S cluster assembly iron-binding protein IscA
MPPPSDAQKKRALRVRRPELGDARVNMHAHLCRVVSKGQATLVCDPVSYEFVRGSTIDYTTDIIRSAFEASQDIGCVAMQCQVFGAMRAVFTSCNDHVHQIHRQWPHHSMLS